MAVGLVPSQVSIEANAVDDTRQRTEKCQQKGRIAVANSELAVAREGRISEELRTIYRERGLTYIRNDPQPCY
jgi:hypothetical protein